MYLHWVGVAVNGFFEKKVKKVLVRDKKDEKGRKTRMDTNKHEWEVCGQDEPKALLWAGMKQAFGLKEIGCSLDPGAWKFAA
jgi:hypothetical protein